MSIYITGCSTHLVTDCGCAGYPSVQNVLRDCGNDCIDWRHTERCISCQAADQIDRYKTRSERYLERIVELQEELEALTPPAGYVAIHMPIDTVERIVETDRVFHALEQLRDSALRAWEGV
jgi:hypothetical protein